MGETVHDEGSSRSDRWLQAGEFTPLREAATHDLAVVRGRQEMPTRTEERCEHPKDLQESLGVPWAFETPHAASPFSGGLVGVLRLFVKPPIPVMLNQGLNVL